jgi:N-acetylglucosaminyldiphosphoundecaprenol N-acetyl-beta-D-mannosaminyltransferase
MIENDVIIERINSSGADIVWVGLGTPKQELWMADHRARLNAAALIGVGAAFDFHAGVIRQAPAFLQRLGLEWFFRMAMEPRRLGKRYLRNVPEFLALLVVEKLRSAIRKNARKR